MSPTLAHWNLKQLSVFDVNKDKLWEFEKTTNRDVAKGMSFGHYQNVTETDQLRTRLNPATDWLDTIDIM